jgi:phage-related protein
MKLKLLKGIVYDLCDSVSSPPFHSVELIKNKIPIKDIWRIDLKNNKVYDSKGKSINISFRDKHHIWFLKQIKKRILNSKILKKQMK